MEPKETENLGLEIYWYHYHSNFVYAHLLTSYFLFQYEFHHVVFLKTLILGVCPAAI